MTNRNDSLSLHNLASDFVITTGIDGQPTRWFWRGAWYVWNGSYYQPASQESLERDILRFLKAKSVQVKISTIRGIAELLRLEQFLEVEQAPSWLNGGGNADPMHLFPVKNGLLKIRKTAEPELLNHTPAFWGMSSTNFGYSRDSSSNLWLGFLDQLWSDNPDAQAVLQEWIGYCLLPNTSQQKILAIIGLPRSGKSTIARVVTELLGRANVASPSIRSLSGHFGLWGLLDKSLAIIPDATLPRPCPALEEVLKSISGEDSVDIHRKGMAPLVGLRLPTRLMLLANEHPAFHDPSGALERRLIVLRTEQSFYGKEDIHLTNKLIEELPGILNWAIEGLKRLWKRGRFPDKTTLNADALLDNLPDRDRVRRIVISYDQPRPRRSRSRRRDRQTSRPKKH